MSNPLVRALIVLVGTTGFETAGLIFWVEMDKQGNTGIGLIGLFIGLVLERLVIAGLSRDINVWLRVLGTSWWEYAAWALWFILIQDKGLPAFGVFALVLLPGLHFQHAFLISADGRRTFAELARHPGFLAFSLIEAIGGGLWLAALNDPAALPIPAHVTLIIAITIEHIVQGFVLNAINNEGVLPQISEAT